MAEKTQRARRAFSPLADWLLSQSGALAVLLVGAAFIVGGLDLARQAGHFPIMLGAVVVILALLEIISGSFSKTTNRQEAARAKPDRQEVKAIAWIFLTIVAIYVSGILLGAFISTVLFCRFIEGRGLLKSLAISMLNVFVIWFAFSYLASFDLYRGAIF